MSTNHQRHTTAHAIAHLLVLILLAPVARAGIINVPADQPTIQAGIDAAVNGDEVVLSPGIYFESGIDLSGKAITLRSTNPADPFIVNDTTIFANGVDTVLFCQSGEGPDTVVNGLTITGGGGANGGGLYVNGVETKTGYVHSTPTVMNCVFAANTATFDGGGIYAGTGGNPTVTNCTFLGNVSGFDGGGMYIGGSSPTITGCVFSSNSAFGEDGGGLYNNNGSPQIADCTFHSNSSVSRGGGIYSSGGTPLVIGCTFQTNDAGDVGGGLFLLDSSPSVVDCTFDANSADNAGGMYIGGSTSNPSISSCVFSNHSTPNSGAAMQILQGASPSVNGCTFTGNDAGGAGGAVQVTGGSPEFIVCDFIQNTAVNRGGGARVEFGATSFLNCRFIENEANRGGGLACSDSQGGDYEVMNCVFSGNSTTASGGGGGIQNLSSSTLRVRNSTIIDNNADQGAGGIRTEDASTFVYNSIVFFNEGNEIGNNPGGSTTVRHSDIQGGHGGAGNVDVTPSFMDRPGDDGTVGTADDDLRLSYNNGSIVDAGDDAYVPGGIGFDLGGESRIIDGDADSVATVDMGAYERQRPDNDECEGAIPVAEGTTAFTRMGATTEGPVESTCFSHEYDVWYSYEATCDGMVEVAVTHPTNCCFALSVYDTSCPTEPDTAIACANWPDANLTFLAVAGEVYSIRIGNGELPYSSGDLTITCLCPGDTNDSGTVDVTDLLNVILDWGSDGSANGGDVDGSGVVDVTDLLAVILAWGTCP